MWQKLSTKRMSEFRDESGTSRRVSPSALRSNSNFETGGFRSPKNDSSPLFPRNQQKSALSRAKSKLTQQSEKSKSLLAVIQD